MVGAWLGPVSFPILLRIVLRIPSVVGTPVILAWWIDWKMSLLLNLLSDFLNLKFYWKICVNRK